MIHDTIWQTREFCQAAAALTLVRRTIRCDGSDPPFGEMQAITVLRDTLLEIKMSCNLNFHQILIRKVNPISPSEKI